jgi:hypothetical protein
LHPQIVLRYAFNSGITVSEELSRWLMVWPRFSAPSSRCASMRISAPTPWFARFRQAASASALS